MICLFLMILLPPITTRTAPLCPYPPLFRFGRDRAEAVADAGRGPADAAVEPVKRGREDPRQRAGGGTAFDVVRASAVACHRVRADAPASGVATGCRAAAGAVAAVAVAGVVDRPAARTQGERAVGFEARIPRSPVPTPLGFLQGFRHHTPPPAAPPTHH